MNNTLHDLRETLDRHAADVHDETAAARVAAVAGRARVVRRRRAAGVGAAAVLAAAAALAVPTLTSDRTPQPANRTVLGSAAPESLTSLGWTYHFAGSAEDTDQDRLRFGIERRQAPQLLTWTTAGEDQRVVVRTDDGERTVSGAADFTDFVWLRPGYEGDVTVRAEGPGVGIALYQLGDERPEGITVDGITFRQQVADQTLIDGVIGDVGDTDVSLEFTVPDGGLRISELCTGVPTGYWVNVEVEDRGPLSIGGCSETPPIDAGSADATSYDPGDFPAGEKVTARTWVSRRVEGPAVELPGARLGVAAYVVAEPAGRVAGHDAPTLVEYDGHLWEYDGQLTREPGTPVLEYTNTDGVPQLVQSMYSGAGDRQVDTTWNGGRDVALTGTGNGVSTFRLQPGSRARMVVEVPVPDGVRLGFAFYGRFD
ncbi:hypothetical protein [Nocardioides sp.]|uniref:hypothetical protein n=1 Tax=Nocardioides sp. TaxID=35761 RepID=UPI002ED4E717